MRTDSFAQLLSYMNTSFRDWPAFICEGRNAGTFSEGAKAGGKSAGKNKYKIYTYHDLYSIVRKQAERMRQDDRECIGICGSPSPEWAFHMFAAVCAGKRTVLLDPSTAGTDLPDLMKITGMDGFWTDREPLQQLFDKWAADPELAELRERERAKYSSDNEGIECGGKLLFFTSGTTARKKAVVLSQKALLSSAWNGQQMMHCTEKDTVLCLLPLNHVFGFVCAFLWPLTNGAAVAFGRGMRYISGDPKYFHATILPVVPTLLKYLLKTDGLNKELTGLLVGAGPCDLDSLRTVWMRGIDLRFGYGLTETASGLAISLWGENPFSMALCPETQVSFDQDGQVYVRTTCMMDGYYHDPEHTAEKLTDRGLATGDIGNLDDRGHLHIRGRIDDVLVRSNGEKIFLQEWEPELVRLTGAEAALLEMNHRLTLVVRREESEEIFTKIDDYNKTQPIGRRIDDVRFCEDEFPRTQTGKLQRWKLAELLTSDHI